MNPFMCVLKHLKQYIEASERIVLRSMRTDRWRTYLWSNSLALVKLSGSGQTLEWPAGRLPIVLLRIACQRSILTRLFDEIPALVVTR